jgi:hypothetical protein
LGVPASPKAIRSGPLLQCGALPSVRRHDFLFGPSRKDIALKEISEEWEELIFKQVCIFGTSGAKCQ